MCRRAPLSKKTFHETEICMLENMAAADLGLSSQIELVTSLKAKLQSTIGLK